MDYSNRNLTELGGMDEDMKLQIHCMEKEAYSNVLRAFIAQSDLLSWGKEGLITELRKELNVTDTEHGELLVKINSDESIKLIREWRKGERHLQEPLYGKVKAPGFASNPVGNALQKKVKTSQPSVSKSQHYVSHGVPSLGTQSWKYVPHIPPTSGSLPSSVPVQTRDDQHSGEFAMFSSGKPEQSTRIDSNNYQAPADGKRKVVLKSQPKKGSHAPAAKKRSDVIEIRPTDKLLHQDLCRAEYAASGANPLKFWLVERTIYGTKNPNPVQVEKAKLVLREHERAILEALDKLADVSDGDDSPNALQQHLPHKERAGNGRGTLVPGDFYRQMGGSHGYQSEGFVPVHPVRLGVPCINLQGEEETP